jgi:hypothetical protein
MELAPALPKILGDRVQLWQVIINLVMNGIEAIESVTAGPRELVIRSGPDETRRVFVSVTDCDVGSSNECRGFPRLNGFQIKSHLLLALDAFNRSVENSGFAKLASSAARVKVRVFAAHSRRVAPAEAKVL